MTEWTESASQTAGPYVHIGCTPNFAEISNVYPQDLGTEIASGNARGTRITVTGTVFDGDGQVLRDALIEIWQADANGRYRGQPDADPAVTGWGRIPTNLETGTFQFDTIKPGSVAIPDGSIMAPHLLIWIVARGINIGLTTRAYFEDEPDTNAACPILSLVPEDRRATLLARKTGDGYHFDIRLQGKNETVFFDI